MKICNSCNETKPATEYYFQIGKTQNQCKDCQKSYARTWAEINRKKILETRAKYDVSKYRTKRTASLISAGATTWN